MSKKFVVNAKTSDGHGQIVGPFDTRSEALDHINRIGLVGSAHVNVIYPVKR